MSHSWWLPSLNGNKLFEGKPEQVKAWSDLFMIRAQGRNGDTYFYISMKNGPFKVEGTPEFNNYIVAKAYLAENWKAMYDDIFEKEILGGSEDGQTNEHTED